MIKFIICLIVINVLLSAWWLINGDIHFDRDVARDFLVIDNIVRDHNFTLLGPRSSLPGVFHGPLWFYLNLPAFLLGGGNPIIVGWFWFLLSVSFLWLIFLVAKSLFDFKTGLLASLLLSVNSIVNPSVGLKNFYNPYGAVYLTPIFFFTLLKYINTLKVKYLLISLFVVGLIVQFQVAFGIPILLATTLFLIYFLFKSKKFIHFASFLILLIPLSTFILFDIRHDLLQIKSFLGYFQQGGNLSINFLDTFVNHTIQLFFNFFDFLSPGKNIFTIIYIIFFLAAFLYAFKKSKKEQKIYLLFGYLFLFFLISSFLFQGSVGNYFWPFLPLTIIILCSFYKLPRLEKPRFSFILSLHPLRSSLIAEVCNLLRLHPRSKEAGFWRSGYKFINGKIFITAFVVLYLINLQTASSAILDFKTDVTARGPHSFAFNLMVAKKVYEDARQSLPDGKGDFGYFTYSPDRYAYQQRYAFLYTKKFFPNINSFSSEKKPLTYLIEVDPPKDRPELSSISWRISDIKLNREADQTFRFDFIQVEKYYLSDEEIKILANPLILDYMFFR